MRREEFKLLFDAHFEAVRNYIYYRCGDADLATDIAQDTFMKVWEKKIDYTPDKIVGLLYKISKDLFVSRYRRDQLHKQFENSIHIQVDEQTPEILMESNELNEKYQVALASLPEKQRVVFLMSRNDGFKYHEIAEKLSVSVKAVEKRMKNALDFLRITLKQE